MPDVWCRGSFATQIETGDMIFQQEMVMRWGSALLRRDVTRQPGRRDDVGGGAGAAGRATQAAGGGGRGARRSAGSGGGDPGQHHHGPPARRHVLRRHVCRAGAGGPPLSFPPSQWMRMTPPVASPRTYWAVQGGCSMPCAPEGHSLRGTGHKASEAGGVVPRRGKVWTETLRWRRCGCWPR